MTPTRTNDITEVDDVTGPALRAALGGEPSTDLAVPDQTAVERVVTALSDAEWDDVPDGHVGATVKVGLPRINLNMKVGQKASSDTKASGFTDTLTGAVFMEADFVWIGDTVTRAYFPLPFGEGDKEPACRSANGIEPDPRSPAQQPGWQVPTDRKGNPGSGTVPTKKCGDCPNAKWIEGEGSPCSDAVEVMVYLLDQERLALVRFGGMGVARVHSYLGALKATIPVRPPLAFVTHVELEEKPTKNGTFLVPRFTPVGDIPRSNAGKLIELQRAKLTEWVEQLQVEVAEGRTRDEGNGSGGEEPFGDAPAGHEDEEF